MPFKTSVMRVWVAALAAVVAWVMLSAPSARAQSFRLIRDAEVEHIIRLYTDPLLRAADIASKSVKIVLIQDSSLNAFVYGGRNIFIHTGLIDAAETPAQLIGVMAHEIGHIAGNHLIKIHSGLEKAQLTSYIATALGILGGIAAGRPDVTTAVIAGGFQIAERNLLRFSRVHESQADQFALRILDDTRQTAVGLQEFFGKLKYQEAMLSDSRYLDPYVRTHPLSRARFETVAAHVKRSPYSSRPIDPALQALHDRMRAKLRAFINPPSRTLRQYPATDTSIPSRYARAILHMRQGDLKAGLPAVDDLIRSEPRNAFFHEMRGQMLLESGRVADSLQNLLRAVELAPREPLLRLLYAHALVEYGTEDAARHAVENLRIVLHQDRELALAWRLAARSYYVLGEEGPSAYADAEYNYLRGDLNRAAASARRASDLLPKGSRYWNEAQYVLNKITEQKQEAQR